MKTFNWFIKVKNEALHNDRLIYLSIANSLLISAAKQATVLVLSRFHSFLYFTASNSSPSKFSRENNRKPSKFSFHPNTVTLSRKPYFSYIFFDGSLSPRPARRDWPRSQVPPSRLLRPARTLSIGSSKHDSLFAPNLQLPLAGHDPAAAPPIGQPPHPRAPRLISPSRRLRRRRNLLRQRGLVHRAAVARFAIVVVLQQDRRRLLQGKRWEGGGLVFPPRWIRPDGDEGGGGRERRRAGERADHGFGGEWFARDSRWASCQCLGLNLKWFVMWNGRNMR